MACVPGAFSLMHYVHGDVNGRWFCVQLYTHSQQRSSLPIHAYFIAHNIFH